MDGNFKMDSFDASRWSLEHTEEKIGKSRDVDFFFTIVDNFLFF